MPLNATNFVQNGHLIHQDVGQFFDLLTGVMTDQPVFIANTLKLGGKLFFAPDNTYDIGTGPFAERPRDVNVGRVLNVPGYARFGVEAVTTNNPGYLIEGWTTVPQTSGANQKGIYVDFLASTNAVTIVAAQFGWASEVGSTGITDAYGIYIEPSYLNGVGIPRTFGIRIDDQSDSVNSMSWGLYIDKQRGSPNSIGIFNDGTTKLTDFIEQTQIVKPANPPAGTLRIYPKSDKHLWQLDENGVETDLTLTGGGGGGGGIGSSAVVFQASNVTGTSVTLPSTPIDNGVTAVSINGQTLIQFRDWNVTGNVITFTTALSADDVHVVYMIGTGQFSGTFAVHYETKLNPGDISFVLPQAPSGVPLLTRSGVVQYATQGHYSISGSTVTLGVMINTTEDGRISVDFVAGDIGGLTNISHRIYEVPAMTGPSLTLPEDPTTNGILSVEVNGQALLSRDWSISGRTITFVTPLTSADARVVYVIRTSIGTDAASVNGLGAYPSGNPQANQLVGLNANGQFPSKVIPPQINLLTNGGFDVWQRGNGPFTLNQAYTADRWLIGLNGTDTMSVTNAMGPLGFSPQCTFTLGTGNGGSNFRQEIKITEMAYAIIGQSMSVSMVVACNTPNAVRLAIWNGAAYSYSPYHPGDNIWRTLTATFSAVDGAATQIQVAVFFYATCVARLDNAMLTMGLTPVDYIPDHPADVVGQCQRYYQRIVAPGNDCIFGSALCTSAAAAYGFVPLPTETAVNPTMTVSAVGDFRVWQAGSTPATMTALTQYGGTRSRLAFAAGGATGLVAGNATMLTAMTNGWIAAEANP